MNATLRPFQSFRVGERAEYVRTVTEDDVVDFARISGDDNALHLDEALGDAPGSADASRTAR